MGALSGLGGFGLGNLDSMSLYEIPDEKEAVEEIPEKEEEAQNNSVDEMSFLFEKSYKCPICDKDFKSLCLKAGRARLIKTDKDLRPIYDGIEPLKYDIVMCPRCGNTALTRYWGVLSPSQMKNVKEEICKYFKPSNAPVSLLSYDDAAERYQMAFENAIVKNAKASEKAYIQLKKGWLLHAKAETLNPYADDYMSEMKATIEGEEENLRAALEGFVSARQKESMPICGMDETTLDYLIASLMIRFEQYEPAAKLIGAILTSRTASTRMKDKARELKDDVIAKMK